MPVSNEDKPRELEAGNSMENGENTPQKEWADDNELEQQKRKKRNDQKRYRKRSEKYEPPTGLEYKEIGPISRTMHWDYYVKCAKDESFRSYKMDSSYKTLLPKEEGFIWFRALRMDRTTVDNDWFGNVRCSFHLLELLKDDPEINMYYVDTSYFGYSSASRILLTKENPENYKKLELDTMKYGDPIIYVNGKVYSLELDVSRNKKWWGKHTTEFVIDTHSISPKELFKLCEKEAVNHSHANKKYRSSRFRPHQCFIYNSSLRKECPFAWTEIEMQEELNQYKNDGSDYVIPVEVPTYERRAPFNDRRFRRGNGRRRSFYPRHRQDEQRFQDNSQKEMPIEQAE